MYNSGVVNVCDLLNAAQSHAVEIHFDAQLLDRSPSNANCGRILGINDRIACTCKQDFGGNLPPKLCVALSPPTMTVVGSLSRVALRTFHHPLLHYQHYNFSNAP